MTGEGGRYRVRVMTGGGEERRGGRGWTLAAVTCT